jgi:hypothetical protein
MVEKPQDPDTTKAPEAGTATATATPRRPGHRGADVRDTVAEMAARAQEISLEAGSKIAAAMKDVIGAAAGLTGFALESARDIVQYMVRRGQMTQDEADKLLREVEESQGGKRAAAARPTPPRSETVRPEPVRPDGDGKRYTPVATPAVSAAPARPVHKPAPAKPPVKAAAAKARPAAKKPAARARPVSKKTTAKAAKKKR